MTNIQSIFSNFLFKFKLYLEKGNHGSITVKNYLSDLRSFFEYSSKSINLVRDASALDLAKTITNPVFLNDYFSYLQSEKKPTTTIKRKASSIRSFISLCLQENWLKHPINVVFNGDTNSNLTDQNLEMDNNDALLNIFRFDLKQEHLDPNTIANYLSDIREFLAVKQN